MSEDRLHSRFQGCLLGVALGDALGAPWEGHHVLTEAEVEAVGRIPYPFRYTDDTHMTIGVAESLIECRGFDGAHMAERFVSNYFREPWRGYGPGPPRVFQLLRDGQPWRQAAAQVYRDGSFGNGAAMRVSPVGLLFWNRPDRLREVAYESSHITHSHPLGMEGAALQGRAVALAVAQDPRTPLDVPSFIAGLLDFAREEPYRAKLGKLATLLQHPEDRQEVVAGLGNGVEALTSVPTAIFSFLSHSQDFSSAVTYAVSLGGDTDTIASMAGAISGAYLGIDALPAEWQGELENRGYIAELAGKLWQLASTSGGQD